MDSGLAVNQKERVMKRLALVIGLSAAGIAAATPAHADYALVQFGDGFCRVWWDSAGVPWGVGWTKLSIGFPDYAVALDALDSAIVYGACR